MLSFAQLRALSLQLSGVLAIAGGVGGAAAGCNSAAGSGATITLGADRDSAPADGLSVVHVTATVSPADAAAVLTFEMAGAGNVTATNAAVVNGKASVDVIAPEEDFFDGASTTSTISARYASVKGVTTAPVTSSRELTFTVPLEGPPKLKAHTEPDHLVVTDGVPMKLVIEGRRLTSHTVHIATSSTAVTLPPTAELSGEGALTTVTVTVQPPSERATVPVTLTTDDGVSLHVDLHFIEEGDPEFDLNGDFVQLTYGSVKISGVPGMETQCVSSSSVSLIHVTQDGATISMTSEVCAMDMPGVTFGGILMQPTVLPGFVAASNTKNPGALSFTLDSVEAGAAFAVPDDALESSLVLGATLAHPDDALPTEPNTADHHTAETDDDGDGQPGVTIGGDGFLISDQHICSKTHTTKMTGNIVSSAYVNGVVESATETVVFGGSMSPAVEGLPSEWHLQRVDGTNNAPDIGLRDGVAGVSCADVKSYAAEIKRAHQKPDLTSYCQE